MQNTDTIRGRNLSPLRCPRRCAASTIEVLVAFTLLTSVLSVSTPLVVRHGRLLAAHRQYRVALDELTNQLDRFTALPPEDVTRAVQQLAPSPFAVARLPGVKLQAQLAPADVGQRLTLTIAWGERERRQAPLSLAGWMPRTSPATAGQPEQEQPQ
jgi:hypothetical protein